jgi:hypothetical protein
MKRAILPLLLLGGLPAYAGATCYTVYDPQNRIVFRAPYTPVDLSGPITAAVRAKFPGGHMVISDEDLRCTLIEPNAPFDPFTGAVSERMPGYEAKK